MLARVRRRKRWRFALPFFTQGFRPGLGLCRAYGARCVVRWWRLFFANRCSQEHRQKCLCHLKRSSWLSGLAFVWH
jgi:hypothetical protein